MALLNFWNNLGEDIRKIHIPAHILVLVGIASMFTGNTSWAWLLAVYPAWFLCGHIGFGIFVHKYYCHNSFETYDWIARLGAYLSLLTGAGSPLKIKVLHIGSHHPHSDTELDPHTPTKGLLWSYLLWQNHKWDLNKIWVVKDMMRDPYIKFYHKHNYKIYWGTWLLLALIDWRLAVFTVSVATFLEFHMIAMGNTFCHYKHPGTYQNYPEKGNSQNVPWLNWITLGLGLHNNHHADPRNYNHAHKKGEIDFSAWFVPLIEKRKSK